MILICIWPASNHLIRSYARLKFGPDQDTDFKPRGTSANRPDLLECCVQCSGEMLQVAQGDGVVRRHKRGEYGEIYWNKASVINQLILVFQISGLVGALVWLRHVAATSSFQLRLLLTIGLPSFCEGLCIGISAAAGCIAWSRCFLLWSRFLCCSGNSLDSSTATSRWHANASSATRTLGLSWHMIIHDYLTERIGMDCLVHHRNEA